MVHGGRVKGGSSPNVSLYLSFSDLAFDPGLPLSVASEVREAMEPPRAAIVPRAGKMNGRPSCSVSVCDESAACSTGAVLGTSPVIGLRPRRAGARYCGVRSRIGGAFASRRASEVERRKVLPPKLEGSCR